MMYLGTVIGVVVLGALIGIGIYTVFTWLSERD